MKVYMIFTREDTITQLLHMPMSSSVFDYVNDKKWVLYAYTTKKSYVNAFFEIRNKTYFHLTVRNMDKSEFEEFETHAIKCKLDKYEYSTSDNDDPITLITTNMEYDESKYGWLNIISNEAPDIFGYLPYYLLDTLNDKYLEAMHDIGLNSMIVVVDPELEAAMNVADVNFDDTDYVITVSHEGDENLLGRKVMLPITIYGKSFNVFIHLFKKILK